MRMASTIDDLILNYIQECVAVKNEDIILFQNEINICS
jgi:hypothetical protein